MSADDDYSAYVGPDDAAPAVDLNQLQEMAERQAQAQAEVARLEAELNRAKETLKDLAERQVPELMDQIGIEDFRTRTGLRIRIEESIRASIPKERTFEAFAWLQSNNSASLIKRKVAVEFGKGEDAAATELAAYLKKQGYAPENEAKVHPQTLGAWVREKLKAGVEIPLDLFGVFRQRVSKIETGN